MSDTTTTNHILVDGIVARRDHMPYVRLLFGDNQVAQLSTAEARKVASDIVQMCARTEADAMIHKFFNKQGFPEGAGNALMVEFRNFRHMLDAENVEGYHTNPDTGSVVDETKKEKE